MNTFTLVLAAYGAALSTIGIIWQFKRWRDRVRGRIMVQVQDSIMTATLNATNGPFVVFKAVNDGAKPVTLRALGLEVRGTKSAWQLVTAELPSTLKEGEEVSILHSRSEVIKMLEQTGMKAPWNCTAFFWSNAGRKYHRKFQIKP